MQLASRVRRRALLVWSITLSVLALWGCGAAPAPGTHSSAAAAQERPAETKSRGFFYEVSGKQATVYILGSVHVGKQDFYPLDKPIESAFERADTLVLEIDLSEKERLSAATQAVSEAVYPPGDSLDRHVDDETLALLKEHLKTKNLPFEAFQRLRPWMAGMTLALLEMQSAGFDPEQGIDLYFARHAGDKKIIGIETAEEQLALFTGMSERNQALMLKQMLETIDEVGASVEKATDAWLRGDEQALERDLILPLRTPEYEPVFQKVFVERNVKMTRAIEKLLGGKGVYFVVVGAGHVIGDEGIVRRLRDRRYSVVRR